MSESNSNVASGLRASDLEQVFFRAGVLRDELEHSKSARAKSTKIGNFLSKNINREFTIEVNGRIAKAVLRWEQGSGRSKLYWFDVTWLENSTPIPGGTGSPDVVAAVPMLATLPTLQTITSADREGTSAAPTACEQASSVLRDSTGNSEEW